MSKDIRFNKEEYAFANDELQNFYRNGKNAKRGSEEASSKNKRSSLRRSKKMQRDYEYIH